MAPLLTRTGPVRFALVGLGGIGQAHRDALATVDGATLAAIVEPRREVGEPAAQALGIPWMARHDDPRLAGLVDAAIVATPPSTHDAVVADLLDAGLHVLCEKPFTLSVDAARAMVGRAAEAGKLLMMASKFRYVDDLNHARELVQSGALGDVVFFENAFFGKVAMGERWNANPEIGGGGVLMDNGTHSVDVARFLLGPIAEVSANLGRSVQGLAVEDSATLQLRTEGGVLGTVTLSWSVNGGDSYVHLYGTKGNVVLEWRGAKKKLAGDAAWTSFGTGYGKISSLANQLKNFVATLRGDEAPRITGEDAVASVAVIQAAYASARKGGWQKVEASR